MKVGPALLQHLKVLRMKHWKITISEAQKLKTHHFLIKLTGSVVDGTNSHSLKLKAQSFYSHWIWVLLLDVAVPASASFLVVLTSCFADPRRQELAGRNQEEKIDCFSEGLPFVLEKIACGTWTWCKSDLLYKFIIKSFHLFFSAKCYANDPRSVRSFRLNQFSTTVAGISTSKSAIGPVDACQTMSYIALVWFTMDWFRSSSDQISHSEHQFMDCLRAVRSDVITEVRRQCFAVFEHQGLHMSRQISKPKPSQYSMWVKRMAFRIVRWTHHKIHRGVKADGLFIISSPSFCAVRHQCQEFASLALGAGRKRNHFKESFPCLCRLVSPSSFQNVPRASIKRSDLTLTKRKTTQ